MGYKDNREYIKALEKTGDIVTVKQEIDWDVELGAVIRRGCELRAPAILCENIKDYPGWEIRPSSPQPARLTMTAPRRT